MDTPLTKRDTGRWIEGTGFVRRLLNDQSEGSHHQRIVIQVPGGGTLLVAHNIELAERVPVGLGDRIHFRGLYEWNEEGGLIHWTHHDPMGEDDGGYVRFRRRVYA
ncbi:MAG: DUF3465 domain-containing protein [Pseudomonadota bacterium]